MTTTKRIIKCQAKEPAECRIHGSESYMNRLVEKEYATAQAGNVSEYLAVKEEIDALEQRYDALAERRVKEMEKEMTSPATPDPYLLKSRWRTEDAFIEKEHQEVELYDEKATLEKELEMKGGRSEFDALFDLEGNLIPAKLIETQYGMSWAILSSPESSSSFSGKFFNASKAKSLAAAIKNNAKKGYYVGKVIKPGVVKVKTYRGYYAIVEAPYIAEVQTNFDSPEIEILDNGL